MDHPKQRHGNHTWDLVLHYYRCARCGTIMENREKFEPRFHRFQKEIVCPVCQQTFTVEKKPKTSWGPLLSNEPDIDE